MSASTETSEFPLRAIKGEEDDLDPLAAAIEQDVSVYSIEDINGIDETAVFFITGQTFCNRDVAELLTHVYDSRSFLVVLPPFTRDVLTIDEPEGQVEIESRTRSTTVHPRHQLNQHLPLDEFRLVSRNVIETSLGVVLAVDEDAAPVLVSYQPTNTHGGVILSTIELASYELKSDETHRNDLLQGILSYITAARIEKTDTTTDGEEADQVVLSDTLINNALLGLHGIQNTDVGKKGLEPAVLQQQLPKRFTFQPSEEEWTALQEYLANESVITEDGIREEVLAEMITARRLDPYARRING